MERSVGLDFGTTNSAVGLATPDGQVTLARFPHRRGMGQSPALPRGASPSTQGDSDTFRSILYFRCGRARRWASRGS